MNTENLKEFVEKGRRELAKLQAHLARVRVQKKTLNRDLEKLRYKVEIKYPRPPAIQMQRRLRGELAREERAEQILSERVDALEGQILEASIEASSAGEAAERMTRDINRAQELELAIRSAIKSTIASAKYDVFISHASEDKQEVARPLAENLISLGLRVWYDEFSLTLGDSLRRSIDKGVRDSKFGVVVLSEKFFEKPWPQYELDALTAREIEEGKVILPIWHKITKQRILRFSPGMADKVAILTEETSLDDISLKVYDALQATNGEA